MNFGMWQHLWHLIIQTLVGLVEGSERWVMGKELTMAEILYVFCVERLENTEAVCDASQAEAAAINSMTKSPCWEI